MLLFIQMTVCRKEKDESDLCGSFIHVSRESKGNMFDWHYRGKSWFLRSSWSYRIGALVVNDSADNVTSLSFEQVDMLHAK